MAGLFGDLLEMAFKRLEVAPSNTTARCLNSTEGAGACTACLDVCPHEAVTIGQIVEIDPVDCTGCGLCVRACPTEALEMETRVADGAMTLRCSEVKGDAPSVRCLAQLSPTDIYRQGARSGELTLVHGACDGCKVGDATAPDVARGAASQAAELAELRGATLSVTIEQRDSADDERRARRELSRRELFGGGLREARRVAADSLAPLERLLPQDPEDVDRDPLPTELLRRYRAIELAEPEPQQAVPWRLPRVDDGCILCPACTRACPTDAFSRDFESSEGVLKLDPERCLGCDACLRACPVKVIAMDDTVTWEELSGGTQEAYRPSPERRPGGSFHR